MVIAFHHVPVNALANVLQTKIFDGLKFDSLTKNVKIFPINIVCYTLVTI